MRNRSARFASLGGIAVGPVTTAVGEGGMEVGVRMAVALGATVACAAVVGAAAGAVETGSVVAVDKGVSVLAAGVLAPAGVLSAGVLGSGVVTERTSPQALTVTMKHSNTTQRRCLIKLVTV